MREHLSKLKWGALAVFLALAVQKIRPQDTNVRPSSYAPVDLHESFATVMSRMVAAKAEIMKRQTYLLEQRYDLSDRPASGATMSRGKPLQEGVRVKLAAGVTWDQLSKSNPDDIRERGLFPAGFMPLPHPN
jgi:cytochrome c peroxidase